MVLRRFVIVGCSLLVAASIVAAGPFRHPNDIAPKTPPVVTPLGQVIDKTVPAYQPKFLAVQPPVGRYEERKWAYLNTYAAYPFYGYGGFWDGWGFYGFGFGGYGWGGTSIQNNFGYSR